jgi:ribosome biogenesis protein NSA2
MYQQLRHKQKIQMKQTIRAHETSNVKGAGATESEPSNPIPAYLLDRSNPTTAKSLSSAIKNRRKEAAAKFSVPLPKVRGMTEEEV